MQKLKTLPINSWGKDYSAATFSSDMLAAVIVTIMLIPQSLAYALIAGLPPQMGIYASILPIILYALLGSSRALAVGPVAVVSLMTAASIGKIAEAGSIEYITAAITLAFLSGAFLFLMGVFKLGFIANFLSHPVVSGFITASGIIIAASQLKHILGISAHGHSLLELVGSIFSNILSMSILTAFLGVGTTVFLFWVRKGLKPFLMQMGLSLKLADILAKTGPVIAVILTTFLAWLFSLDKYGVAIVGEVPKGLPPMTLPSFSFELWGTLIGSAILISIIGFVESISVAQTLAAKKRQRINPNQELIALGSANLGAAFTGGFPVTGGFSRSVVNYDAGAKTPAAGAYAAIGLAVAAVFLTPLITYLPKATLAATIIVAVVSLIDFSILKRSWGYSKADFSAVFATIIVTLIFGVELGVSCGVVVSILMHFYHTSKPHMAVVGRVPKTEQYRNVNRHDVITQPHILSIRIDESLYFANAQFLEDCVYKLAAENSDITDVILMCSAVNSIDLSALESLEAINERLAKSNIKLHLSEVKGPVMDSLQKAHFLNNLTGQIFLSQHAAVEALK